MGSWRRRAELFRLPEIAKTLNTTVEQLVMGDAGSGAHIVDEQYAVIDLHPDNTEEGHAIYTLPETLRDIGLPRDVRMMRVQAEDMEPYLRSGETWWCMTHASAVSSPMVFMFCT